MYALTSFSASFFRTDDEFSKLRPFTVEQAIAAMPRREWKRLARQCFHIDPRYLTIDAVLELVIQTNTCTTLSPPVEVWIDSEGFFRLLVYEMPLHISNAAGEPLCGGTQGDSVSWIHRAHSNCSECLKLARAPG